MENKRKYEGTKAWEQHFVGEVVSCSMWLNVGDILRRKWWEIEQE